MKVVIVKDEKPAAEKLEMLLKRYHPDTEILKVLDSVEGSIEWFRENPARADLVFMDIRLTDGLSFEIFKQVRINQPMIFTTAYNEYAVRAFEVNALDYLLKPVNPKRLEKTIERYFESKIYSAKYTKKLEYDDSIFLRIDHSIKFIKLNSIIAINAEGDYSQIITLEGKQGLILKSLKEWQNILPEKHFYRIHRSSIINCNYVKKVENG